MRRSGHRQVERRNSRTPPMLVASGRSRQIFAESASASVLQAPGARPRPTTLESAPLGFAHRSPYPGILAGLERPGEAFAGNGATLADGLGFGNLQKRRPGVPDREEQLRVLVTADCAVAPVHL